VGVAVNVLPNITGHTVANWTFQNTLADSSGNGLTLVTLDDVNFPNQPGGVEQYTTLAGSFRGFLFNGSTRMWAPSTSTLRFTGDFTMQWIGKQVSTTQQSWICCANAAAGRSGGFGPDRIGSMYTIYYSSFNAPAIATQGIGSNTPTATYGVWTSVTSTTWGVNGIHQYTFRRLNGLDDYFVDGVKLPGGSIVDPPAGGTPSTDDTTARFFLGGTEGDTFGTVPNGTVIGALRVLDYGRSDGGVARDAAYMLGPVATASPNVIASLYRYSPQAYGDRYRNPGDS
jgi:hypothetical protein